MNLKNNLILLIPFLLPHLLIAQYPNASQSVYLKAHSITTIEKYEVYKDSMGTKEVLVSKITLNSSGYMTKQEAFGMDGEPKGMYEYIYEDDTLMIKTSMTPQNHPTMKASHAITTYDASKKKVGSSSWYDDKLQLILTYNYSKNGQLKSIDHIWYNCYEDGKKDGKGKMKYNYNTEGYLSERSFIRKINGKVRKEFYTFHYDSLSKTYETYVSFGNDPGKMLYNKTFHDDHKRLVIEDQYSRTGSSWHMTTASISIKKGEARRKTYLYDERGLIESETLSVNGENKLVTLFRYVKE